MKLPRSEKGYFSVLFLVLIAISFGLGGLYLYNIFKTKPAVITSNGSSSVDPLQQTQKEADIYKSPLGFSFKKDNSKITEYSYDINKLKSLKDGDLIYPPNSDTTSSSVGTIIDTSAFTLIATRVDAVGTVLDELRSKMAGGGGDFFQFLSDKSFFEEISSLIHKKTDFSDARILHDSGQIRRYAPDFYNTQNSSIFGFTNFQISGFEVPGLGLFKEYFLVDSNNKYIFYIVSQLSCDKKKQLEDKYRKYNSDGSWTIVSSFNEGEYLKSLHSISKECEETSKNKVSLDLLLNSLKVD